jgi:hypothetical protein
MFEIGDIVKYSDALGTFYYFMITSDDDRYYHYKMLTPNRPDGKIHIYQCSLYTKVG